MIPALFTTVLFALAAVCATQSARALGPVRANFYRLALAVCLLGGWALGFGDAYSGGVSALFFLAGAIGFGGGGHCVFRAFPLLGSTLSLLVVECAAAVSSAVLGWVFLDAAVTPRQGVCAMLAIGGVLVGLGPFHLPEAPRRGLWLGAGLAATAALAQGASWTISKAAFNLLHEQGGSLDGLSAAFQRLLGGWVIAAAAFLALRRRNGAGMNQLGTAASRSSRGVGGWVLGNALAGPVLGVSCMLWAIRSVENPGIVQTVVATATLVSVPFSRRLEHRPLGWNYFCGAGLSILGVAGLMLSLPPA